MWRRSICLAMMLAGCSKPSNPSWAYTFRVDPQFTPSHQEEILQAITAWEIALNDKLQFSQTSFENQADITLLPSTQEDLDQGDNSTSAVDNGNQVIGICFHFSEQQSEIYLAADIADDDFNWVSRHEVGHAIGLSHSDRNNVMCENNTCASNKVTEEDANQVLKLWRRRLGEE